MATTSAGRLADAIAHHEICIALAARTGHHGNLTQSISNYAANRVIGGNLREAEMLLARARGLRTAANDTASVDGFVAMLQAICDYQNGRYRQALAALNESDERLGQYAPGYRASARTHLAVVWSHLGQWSRLRQVVAAITSAAVPRAATRLRCAALQLQADAALGRHVDTEALRDALARLGPDDTPDSQNTARLDLAMHADPAAGLEQVEAVIARATAGGDEGSVIAGHARAARLASALGDADRTRSHARAALALAKERQIVRQYPGELWLHTAEAFAAIGDAEAAAAAAAEGVAWVQRVARDGVPEEFRNSFLNRNPVNRELFALVARV